MLKMLRQSTVGFYGVKILCDHLLFAVDYRRRHSDVL
jgi:hypothetical protein